MNRTETTETLIGEHIYAPLEARSTMYLDNGYELDERIIGGKTVGYVCPHCVFCGDMRRRTVICPDCCIDDVGKAVGQCGTLDELFYVLIILQDVIGEVNEQGADPQFRIENIVDLTSLPTFGGEEPSDTEGVWSWDEQHLLVDGDGTDQFQIIER